MRQLVRVIVHWVLQLSLLQSATHLSLVLLQVAAHVLPVLMHVAPQPASKLAEEASDALASGLAASVAGSPLAESTAPEL